MSGIINKLCNTQNDELLLLIDNGDKLAIRVNKVNLSNNEIGIHYSRLYIQGKNKTTKSETVGLVTVPINKLNEIDIYFEKDARDYLKRKGLLGMYDFIKGDTNG